MDRRETRDIRRACTRNRVVRGHIQRAVELLLFDGSAYFVHFRYNLRKTVFHTMLLPIVYNIIVARWRPIPTRRNERQKI